MKCKVCGKRFTPKSENRYEVTEPVVGGLVGAFVQKPVKIIECFDCPRCGCQNALNTRIPQATTSIQVTTNEKSE